MHIPFQCNLRRRMSQYLAEGFYLKSNLHTPCGERMPQYMKMHILNAASLAVSLDVILQGARLYYFILLSGQQKCVGRRFAGINFT